MKWERFVMTAGVVAAVTQIGAVPAVGQPGTDKPVAWSGPAAASVIAADRVIVQGVLTGSGFQPRTARLPERERPAAPTLLALDRDIVAAFDARSFGEDERVRVIRDGAAIRIVCTAGRRMAGAVLTPRNAFLPRGMNGALVLSVRGSATLGASLVARGADGPDRPQSRPRNGTIRMPLGGSIPLSDVVLTCPEGAAETVIDRIAIVPSPAGRQSPQAGTWVWDDTAWAANPEDFARRANAAGMAEVAVQLRLTGHEIANADALQRLVRAMRTLGGSVHLVEGDPDMVTPDGLKAARRRIVILLRALAAFPDDARPSRLELDIEPHALANYTTDPELAWMAWAGAVRTLSRAWGDRVDVDLPWWMLAAGGRSAIEAARPTIRSIVVMAYRTKADEILAAAEPWLAYGATTGVPVTIAIENGALPVEVHRTYRRAGTGELQAHEQGGEMRVSLHDRPVAGRAGAPVFTLASETRIDPRTVSFCGDNARWRTAIQAIRPILSAWDSFAGLRVHEVLPRDGVQCGSGDG